MRNLEIQVVSAIPVRSSTLHGCVCTRGGPGIVQCLSIKRSRLSKFLNSEKFLSVVLFHWLCMGNVLLERFLHFCSDFRASCCSGQPFPTANESECLLSKRHVPKTRSLQVSRKSFICRLTHSISLAVAILHTSCSKASKANAGARAARADTNPRTCKRANQIETDILWSFAHQRSRTCCFAILPIFFA